MPELATKNSGAAVSQAVLDLPDRFPEVPQEVIERFPTTAEWRDQQSDWYGQLQSGLNDFANAMLDRVAMAGVLQVDPDTQSIFIREIRGPGTYADVDTAFYVNSDGFFSLKNKLTWNPDTNTLTVTGTIVADAGVIGGWNISATTLSKNNAVLDSAGQLALGTGNDIAILSATDATYRLWIGNATAGTAAFSVTKAGALFATGATISGSITATSGSIGGFDIGSDYIRDTANSMGLASTVTGGDDVRFWAGATFANRATAPFRVTEGGDVVATSGTVGGFTLSATDLTAGTGASTIKLSTVITAGLSVGSPTGIRSVHRAGTGGTSASFYLFNSANALAGAFEVQSTHEGGRLTLNNTAGTQSIDIDIDALVAKTTITFDGDTTIYRDSANVLKTDDSLSVAIDLTVGGVVYGRTSAAALSFSFSGDTNSGILWMANDDFRFVAGGTSAFVVQNVKVVCLVPLKLDNGYTAAAMAATGYVTVQDSTGTTYKLLCQL